MNLSPNIGEVLHAPKVPSHALVFPLPNYSKFVCGAFAASPLWRALFP